MFVSILLFLAVLFLIIAVQNRKFPAATASFISVKEVA